MTSRADYQIHRLSFLKTFVDLEQSEGLEIGACDLPTVPSDLGQCEFADFRSTEDLIRTFNLPPETVVPVKYILQRQLDLHLQIDRQFDYVILCHVIEHVPNVIDYLKSLSKLLKPNGIILIACPDKRKTPDLTRPSTALEHLLDDFYTQCNYPTLEHILEAGKAWNDDLRQKSLTDPLAYYEWGCQNFASGLADTHCHAWTDEEFFAQINILTQGQILGELKAIGKRHTPLEFNEFFVVLQAASTKAHQSNSPVNATLESSESVFHAASVQLQGESIPEQSTPNQRYERWLQANTPKERDLRQMAEMLPVLGYQPLISIIMPTFNTPGPYLRAAIDSVQAQIYSNWELCIADDASTAPQVRSILQAYAAQDTRIKVTFRSENGHISQCSNTALELATGEFVALLDHDDLLPPEALYEVVLLLNKHREADMVYSDEDKIDDDGKRSNPYFKPDWCPDTFLSRMYTCHFGVYRRSIVEAIGGFRVGYEGSQDYDLVLRFTEKTDRIFHIPKILYHWRIHPQSAASSSEAKPYAYTAGGKAIQDALDRRGEPGQVLDIPNQPGHYLVRYQIKEYKPTSIIIPTKNLGEYLHRCLQSIFAKTTYPNYEVIVIDNGSTEASTQEVIAQWLNQEPDRFKCYPLDIPFNFSKINNYAVQKASGDFLLFLNNDTEVITPDWLEGMVEQAQRPSIGAVGVKLLYPDHKIQHAGVVMGLEYGSAHIYRHQPADATGYFGQLLSVNNFSAVTGACLMCRREVFEAVQGFNETLAVGHNDIDLCLKMLKAGFRNVLLPHVMLYHYESKSRGLDITPEAKARFFQEVNYMQTQWRSLLDQDPCYNPNLTRKHLDSRIEEFALYTKEEMQVLRNRIKNLKTQLETTKQQKEQAEGRVIAMETSKFWQLRSLWFRAKKAIGLPTDES
jgi:glycosyltransferase involved in cell wall biosynthesis/SAM-dependent methyltransferase